MIAVKVSGDFKRLEHFLAKNRKIRFKLLDKYGKKGVQALAAATPVNTGKTAASWYYEIEETDGSTSIIWKNSNIVDGVPIAVILQYGHGTRNGGYVPPSPYINEALEPIFNKIADEAWKEITES